MRLAAPALLILLAGCSSAPEQDATDLKVSTTEKPAVADKAAETEATPDPSNFKQSAAITLRWRRNIGNVGFSTDQSANPIVHPGLVRWRLKRDYGDMGNSILRPVVLGDSVYVANAKGKILRLKPENGELQWRVDSGITITGGLGGGGGLIVAGGEKGEVLAYDEDGKLRWRALVSSEVLGPPQIAGHIVVVRSGDGRIAGLNAADGKRRWLYEHAMPGLVVRSSAGVTIRGGTIFAGFSGGKLAAIDLASGNLKWEATLSEPRGITELERMSDLTSPPQVDNEVVCAASFQGRVGCFTVAQGSQLWSKEMSSDKGLTLSGKYIYAVNASGELFAMDKNNGSSAWKNAQLGLRHTAAPAVMGDYLVSGEKEGYIYAVKREDGSIAARLRTDGSPILAPPVESKGGLLFQTRNGGLYSVTLN